MKKHNPNNERIKRKYFAFLKEAKRYSEPTVDAAAKALNRFEVYARYRDFKTFHFEQAIAFKRHLACHISTRTVLEIPLSNLAKRSARHRNSSRSGARTSDMKSF